MGTISTVCATIIAAGVNSSPSTPNGPERDSSRNTTSPTTTGGSPIRVFIATDSPRRPGKRSAATAVPSGSPISVAASTAVRLTRSDRPTIRTSPSSSVAIRVRATPRAWVKSCMRTA